MGVTNWLANKLGYVRKNGTAQRGYDAAQMSDLYADFVTSSLSADGENMTLSRVRARSRDISMNNPYGKRFIGMVGDNVVGHQGIRLQNKSIGTQNDPKAPDTNANQRIEKSFKKWGKKGTCTVDGKYSWVDVQRLFIQTVARDGECFIRKVKFKNKFNFALQFIEADHCETDFNQDLPNGNKIRMGVELDPWGRPVAYHFLKNHPGDAYHSQHGQKRVRIPAGEIIHGFIPDRPGATRGVPWAHATLTRFKMTGGYEEAEIVAARGGASKMGFYERGEEASEWTGDDKDSEGRPIDEAKPGHFGILPKGWKVHDYDPSHPAGNFAPFMKAMLRGIASGLGVSYNTMANDLEGVNFSSLRSGNQHERDAWKTIQVWLYETLHDSVFSGDDINWLTMAFLSGQLGGLPMSKFDKFDAATWRPRGWASVDPAKETKANSEGMETGELTLTKILNERGIDLEEHLNEMKHEQDLAEKIGVKIKQKQPVAVPANGDPDDDDEDEEDN